MKIGRKDKKIPSKTNVFPFVRCIFDILNIVA